MCTSATSSSSAGTATSSPASSVGPSYGLVTVRSVGSFSSTAEPSPARIGRNGTRWAAARSPVWNIPSSHSRNDAVASWRARENSGSSGIESSVANA